MGLHTSSLLRMSRGEKCESETVVSSQEPFVQRALVSTSTAFTVNDRWRLLLWQVDEDADDLSFPAMVSQLLEFVLCIVGNEHFMPLLQPVLPELAYLTIGVLPDTRQWHCCQMGLASQRHLPL